MPQKKRNLHFRFHGASLESRPAMIVTTNDNLTVYTPTNITTQTLYTSNNIPLNGSFPHPPLSPPLSPPPTPKRQGSFHTPTGGKIVYGSDGTAYNAKRQADILESTGERSTVFFLSPVTGNESRPENPITPIPFPLADEKELEIRGGEPLEVAKGCHQKVKQAGQVMGHNAQTEMLNQLYKAYNTNQISEETYLHLQQYITNESLEWCHVYARSLSPADFNPQQPSNLGASFAWINTYMMTLEGVARHFHEREPHSTSMQPTFHMAPKTNVAQKIDYTVMIKKEEQSITVSMNDLNALAPKSRETHPTIWDEQHIVQTVEYLFSKKAKPS